MKSVILCADDYALNESVSHGIVALAEAGRLSATSVMTLSPRWAMDAAVLAPWRGRIDVGLHLDWTSEFALAAGHGAPLGALMRRSCWPGCRSSAASGACRWSRPWCWIPPAGWFWCGWTTRND